MYIEKVRKLINERPRANLVDSRFLPSATKGRINQKFALSVGNSVICWTFQRFQEVQKDLRKRVNCTLFA